MSVAEKLKQSILKRGPDSRILRAAFHLQAALAKTRMRTAADAIHLTRGAQEVVLGKRDLISVPFVVHEWDKFFDMIEGTVDGSVTRLDFSRPGLHHYKQHELWFHSPSLAEDDSMDAYLAAYRPRPGDVVWDVGAHAGLSVYFLSKMVGGGKVIAFEPDEVNFSYLLRNVEQHRLANVVPVKAALSDHTGTARFWMDGTMSAGLVDSVSYGVGETREVQTFSLEDACERFGVPTYLKADIEGAELGLVSGSLDFLKRHPMHMVFESNHMVNGEMTAGRLEKLLTEAGYKAWSSDEFGQLFTWAEPRSAEAVGARKELSKSAQP